MSITRAMSDDKNASLAGSLRSTLPDLLFGVLVIYNTIRLFRHAMWRDELQAFMLAAASSTPLELFAKVQYENHPGLWYLLLWVITRFTSDPFFLQVAQLLIALGLWVLIWRLSPFRPFEKLLLLLSFFLLAKPALELTDLKKPLRFVVFAFFPFIWPFAPDALHSLGGWGADLAATDFGANPAHQLVRLIVKAPYSVVLTLIVLAAPILACWIIVRDRALTAQYAVIYVGVLLFAQLWQFPGSPRHHGTLFIALAGTVWMWRSAFPPARPVSSVWVALLMVSALGGLTTLAADVRPFSQGRNAATWLQRHHLDDAFLMSSSDYAGSTVSGYLRRPLYYLECECYGTYIVWNTRRKQSLDIEEVVDRVARVMRADDKNEAYLVFSRGNALERQTIDPNLVFRPLKRFPSATVSDEVFVIYRVHARSQADSN